MVTKALNIILVFSVLFSSTGFVLGSHQCGKTDLQEVAKCSCTSDNGCQDNCCHTDWQYFQLDQDQQSPVVGFEAPNIEAVAIVAVLFFYNETQVTDTQTRQFSTYRPPIVLRNIPVLFQSFLI